MVFIVKMENFFQIPFLNRINQDYLKILKELDLMIQNKE